MTKIWFTADLHLGHKNIIGYSKRPFKNMKHMEEIILLNWNARVSENDIVFVIGDFSFYPTPSTRKIISRLNGTIVWIKGNHDKIPIIQDLVIEYGGHMWHLAHKPEDCHLDYNLCGHVHNSWKVKTEDERIFVNVGVDQWDFKPISIQEILEVIKNGV